ncbi:MAG: hypothetical protein R2762_14395 [Bryobacteraceae bacterium]
MSTTATTAPSARSSGSFLGLDHAARHRLRLRLAWAAVVCFIAAMIVNGYSYYTLPIAERAYSPLHPALRPSGYVGIRLGLLGLALFAMLFLYPIRKRWPWLSRIGKTKHWLDFHVLFGISAPIVITLHSSLKLQGLAGLSYWIMIAVAVSGFVGRYLYSQIPRTLTAAELSFKELEAESARLAEQLDRQPLLKWSEIAPLLALPSREKSRTCPRRLLC